MVELSPHYIALIVYVSVYAFLVIFIGVYVYYSRRGLEKSQGTYFEQVWYAREIYTAVAVHLYDQATDIAVMVQWWNLLKLELSGSNIESVNMLTFFIPGLCFIVLYRVITMVFAIYEDTKEANNSDKAYQNLEKAKTNKKTCCAIMWDLLLSIFDLYFLKIIYLEFWAGDYKPNTTHRSLQLCEALFESMPQVVLQSVFLLRYTADTGGADNTVGLALIIISITASILSIANKYAWFDQQAVVIDAKELNGGRKGECYISLRFILRSIWRWSDLCVRFVIFSLLWVCIGGLYILIYVCLSYLFYYFIVLDRIKMNADNRWYRLLATTICIVGIILDYEWHFCILRLIDNGLLMIIITIFVFVSIDCDDVYCTENSKRNGYNTPIIFVFIMMGLIAYFIELITYPLLQSRKLNIIKKALQGREFFSIILFGDDTEIPTYFLTYYVDTIDININNNGLSYGDIIYFSGKQSNEDCEILAENLENVFKNDDSVQLSTGDIAIDYKGCKVFKYGISIKCLQNVYNKSNQQQFGVEAMDYIKSLYGEHGNYYESVQKVFESHFKDRDNYDDKKWVLTFGEEEATFIILNIDEKEALNENNEGGQQAVVAKYRFGADLKKYNEDIRIIIGHDYKAGLHNESKQVLIKVIDRNEDKKYSHKNADIFVRERMNMKLLNDTATKQGILPYIGWDDADDAYFIVSKRLFGQKILNRIISGITTKQLILYIAQIFDILSYVHGHNIVMRNISLDSFQFDNDDKNNSILYLTHYENSKLIINSDEKLYGNIKGKVIFMSPELCNIIKLRYKNKKWIKNISGLMYKSSDIWSLGIITYYLLCGKHPFYESKARANKLKKTLNNIINHTKFGIFKIFKQEKQNKIFEDFMNKILCNDYKERMTASNALNHEFLSNDFINSLQETTEIKPETIDILKENMIQSKLHEAIGRVRAEEIDENEKRLEIKRESAKLSDAEELKKTDTDIDRLFDDTAEQGMKEQFKRIDLDGDGYTTIDELTKLLTSLGYAINFAQKEAETIMNTLDLDGDGTIDFNEFAQAWVKRKLSINDKYVHAIFNVFDQNGDGFISIDELKKGLFTENDDIKQEQDDDDDDDDDDDNYLDKVLDAIEMDKKQRENNKALQMILDEVDDNKDGKISFDEFHKAMINDMEGNDDNNNDGMPFKDIFNNIKFREINKNGEDPLFENKEDYIDDNDDGEKAKSSSNLNIQMNIQNNLDGGKDGDNDIETGDIEMIEDGAPTTTTPLATDDNDDDNNNNNENENH